MCFTLEASCYACTHYVGEDGYGAGMTHLWLTRSENLCHRQNARSLWCERNLRRTVPSDLLHPMVKDPECVDLEQWLQCEWMQCLTPIGKKTPPPGSPNLSPCRVSLTPPPLHHISNISFSLASRKRAHVVDPSLLQRSFLLLSPGTL